MRNMSGTNQISLIVFVLAVIAVVVGLVVESAALAALGLIVGGVVAAIFGLAVGGEWLREASRGRFGPPSQ